MLKYLIVPLADDAVSFCHYTAKTKNAKSISLALLQKAIVWAMKENLSVQFIYPQKSLTKDILALTDTIDHVKIVPSNANDKLLLANAEVVVFDNWHEMDCYEYHTERSYVIRTSFSELFTNVLRLNLALRNSARINIVITDITEFSNGYDAFLKSIIPTIVEEYKRGHQVQLNILTDRLFLDEMNNCNAGYESLTLAPDGNFYICPGFWIDGANPIGDLDKGLDLKNPQLFKLSHAPICRECDAWQCNRCIWLNNKLTKEVNTPSHEQCVTSHIEREASRLLLNEFRIIDNSFMPEKQISKLNYLDPFDKIININ